MLEDVTRRDDLITLHRNLDQSRYIRPAGDDFSRGDRLKAPRRLSSADIALLAAMNQPEIPVTRRPVVALLATGDELVMPGETPGPDQIIASNNFGLQALLERHGAEVRMLPIARDTQSSLETAFHLAEGADLVVTIGGASVGDHDLVGKVAGDLGLERALHHSAQDDASLQEGVEALKRQLMNLLKAENVTPIETLGRPFDPELHEAIAAIPDAADDIEAQIHTALTSAKSQAEAAFAEALALINGGA